MKISTVKEKGWPIRKNHLVFKVCLWIGLIAPALAQATADSVGEKIRQLAESPQFFKEFCAGKVFSGAHKVACQSKANPRIGIAVAKQRSSRESVRNEFGVNKSLQDETGVRIVRTYELFEQLPCYQIEPRQYCVGFTMDWISHKGTKEFKMLRGKGQTQRFVDQVKLLPKPQMIATRADLGLIFDKIYAKGKVISDFQGLLELETGFFYVIDAADYRQVTKNSMGTKVDLFKDLLSKLDKAIADKR